MKTLLNSLLVLGLIFMVGCAHKKRRVKVSKDYTLGANADKDKRLIAQIMEDNGKKFLTCYKKEFDGKVNDKNQKDYDGMATYRFSLDREGKPKYININFSNPKFPVSMKKCIADQIAALSFPKSRGGMINLQSKMNFTFKKVYRMEPN